MASIAISPLQISCSSLHSIKKWHAFPRPRSSLRAEDTSHVVSWDVEGKKTLQEDKGHTKPSISDHRLKVIKDRQMQEMEEPSAEPKFEDERWKNGSWDLNMFVKEGKIDWDAMIVAEAKRRKFLQIHPEPSTNQAPVHFRSSIIPWWAWLRRFHLPEAELVNGRAAMVGFFMAYLVDGLTGLELVGQTSNFICKAFLLAVVTGVILLHDNKDLGNLSKLIEEATHYDKQWQGSWQDQKGKNVPNTDHIQ